MGFLMNTEQRINSESENVFAGIVGAFLLSLVGGLAFFLLYTIGVISSISGLIGVILAIKGYQWFAKKESIKGIIIASVIALLVLVLAWYLCLGKDIYDAYQTWYKNGEIDFTLTYPESLRAVPVFMQEPEIAREYIKDLILCLVFALIGSIGTIITSIINIKRRNALLSGEAAEPAATEPAEISQESALPIRSAHTDEKVREYLKTSVFGHEVVFRKVAKKKDELLIDGMVYAEHELKKIEFPYEMHVFFDGHVFEAGYGNGLGSSISVDHTVLCKKFRW